MNKHLVGEMKFDSLHFDFSDFPVIEVSATNGVLLSDTMTYPSDTMAAFHRLKARMNPFKVFTDTLIDIPYVYLDKPQATVLVNVQGHPGWAIWRFKKQVPTTGGRKHSKTKLDIAHVEIYGEPRFYFHNFHSGMKIIAEAKDLFLDGRIAIDYKKIDVNYFHTTKLNYSMSIPKALTFIETHADSILIKKHLEQDMPNYQFHVSTKLDTIYVKSSPVMMDNNFDIHGKVGIGYGYKALAFHDLQIKLDTTILWLRGDFRKVPGIKAMYTDMQIRLTSPSLNKTIYDILPLRAHFPQDLHLYMPLLLTTELKGVFSPSKRIYPDIYAHLDIGPGIVKYGMLPPSRNSRIDLDLFYMPATRNSGVHFHSIQLEVLGSTFHLYGSVKDVVLNPYANITLHSLINLKDINEIVARMPLLNGRLRGHIDLAFPVMPVLRKNLDDLKANVFLQVDTVQGYIGQSELALQGGTLDFSLPVRRKESLKDSVRLSVAGSSFSLFLPDKKGLEIQKADLGINLPRASLFSPDKIQAEIYLSDARFHTEKGETFNVGNVKTHIFALVDPQKHRPDSVSLKLAMRGMVGQIDSMNIASRNLGVYLCAGRIHESADSVAKIKGLEEMLDQYDFSGGFLLRNGYLDLPGSAVVNEIDSMELLFTRHLFSLPVLLCRSGDSDLKIKAHVDNWLDYLMRDSTMVAEIGVGSDSLNLSQLIPYVTKELLATGKKKGASADSLVSRLSPPALIAPDSIKERTHMKMFAIPKRVNMRLNVDARNVVYDSVRFDESHGRVLMTEKSIFLHNMFIDSELGNLEVGASYQPSPGNFAHTALSVELYRLDVRKLLEFFPDLHKLVPMLSTLEGYVGCSVSAQADLDTTLYILMPTLQANAQIRGHDLSVEKDRILPRFAGWLLFGKKDKIMLDSIRVNLTMQENVLSVYPFIVDLGRYRLLASGVQNTDDSFFYHLSLLKWFLPIKLGFNIYKENKKLHFGLTCPKLKDLNLPARILSVHPSRFYPSRNVPDSIAAGMKKQQSVFLKYSSYYDSILKRESDEISKKQTEAILIQLDTLIQKHPDVVK